MAIETSVEMHQAESAAVATKDAIGYLLSSFGITELPRFKRDIALENQLAEIVQSYSGLKPTRINIITGAIMSATAYSHIESFETRVFIAVYTMLLGALDCPDVFESLASQTFHRELCSGSVQGGNGILGQLSKLLVTAWDHFPQYSASAILTSTLDFLNMCFVENTSHGSIITPSPDSLPFVEFRRVYGTGISAAYAVFIWEKEQFPDEKVFLQAMPDIMAFLPYVNDIMSFYKEEAAGELGTYITDRAYASGKTHLETLREVVDETVAAATRIRKLLGEGPARDAWDAFVKAYIAFHASTPKYRLHEIMDVHYVLEDTEEAA
ncbi:terpenoid synthase [Obba rivulosa]|uniref:Terpenoid synthase n=1 Tax=Obba rivulosa TaxID=1052685 RepID=A0A8E2AHQ2_9APHY|nr:terpenoid synthase [Obba rivulosa]